MFTSMILSQPIFGHWPSYTPVWFFEGSRGGLLDQQTVLTSSSFHPRTLRRPKISLAGRSRSSRSPNFTVLKLCLEHLPPTQAGLGTVKAVLVLIITITTITKGMENQLTQHPQREHVQKHSKRKSRALGAFYVYYLETHVILSAQCWK